MNPHHSFFLLYTATMHINKLINGGEFWSLDLPLEDDCWMSCPSVKMYRKISCRGCRRQASVAAKKMTRDHHPGQFGKESDVGVEEKTMASPNLGWKDYVDASRKPPSKNLPAVRLCSFTFRETRRIFALWWFKSVNSPPGVAQVGCQT